MNNNVTPLAKGTRVDSYVIDKFLGSGGFSIVYYAHSVNNNERVIIKEYIPQKLAVRVNKTEVRSLNPKAPEAFNKGRKLFFQEASTLAMLKHPNIVNVINFFQANGTTYMVMKDEQGINLQEYISQKKGHLSEKLLRKIFPQLLAGVKKIHEKGMLHLDIKPSNIHLCRGGKPIILDFGAVREKMKTRIYEARVVATPGFAPIEQITELGYLGAWSDIYAVGATMRSCIEGEAPPPADKRKYDDPMKSAAEAFKKQYSQQLLEAIDWAMDPDPTARPQSCDKLLEKLKDLPDVTEPQNDPGLLDRLSSKLPWNKLK